MEIRRDVFQAIADPTRREILNLLAVEPRNLNALAENFSVTRQAISLHIKILSECGLVYIHPQGRERYCEARMEKLKEVDQWVGQYRTFWTKKLQALGTFLEQESVGRRKTRRVNVSSNKTKRR